MELNLKKNDKFTKVLTIILAGVLILIILMPVRQEGDNIVPQNEEEGVNDYTHYEEYYEEKLRYILEDSYGAGTMEVMIRTSVEKDSDFYGEDSQTPIVEGILVVADVDESAVSEIAFAVCALFDLPAHKVAVMIKK
ncbi:MAG: hypothetical protein IJX12_02550 [Lachnospiraceae bacterium]|nr:hypothetical protein [Lachnospiraceae bacterium]